MGGDGHLAVALRHFDAAGALGSPVQPEPAVMTAALQDASSKLCAAAQRHNICVRSHRFFVHALGMARGEASAATRTCCVCLDEDIPVESLSITVCAHIFHTSCLFAVLEKFSSCPMCREPLNASKHVTQLSAELAVSEDTNLGGKNTRGCKKAGSRSNAEFARKFGSKLLAIATTLREICRKDEKAIVFCQWEDLKCKIADALTCFDIKHLELKGNVYQRGEVIRRFQEECEDGAARVLLLSLEHSASGTNLTAANHVIFVHPMNAISAERAVSYEAQAIGRCRRWGQQKSEVHCWRFVVRGTVDETITAQHQCDIWQNHLGKTGVAAMSAPPT